uniref:Uncharacterized protein n=1 Tax=Mycena chlorophos TaxID=658473 RepID=A0ABQ0LX86_MYCCL|nr:predicted protein [Mycena chlorophos]
MESPRPDVYEAMLLVQLLRRELERVRLKPHPSTSSGFGARRRAHAQGRPRCFRGVKRSSDGDRYGKTSIRCCRPKVVCDEMCCRSWSARDEQTRAGVGRRTKTHDPDDSPSPLPSRAIASITATKNGTGSRSALISRHRRRATRRELVILVRLCLFAAPLQRLSHWHGPL